jgi:hypothetical protein
MIIGFDYLGLSHKLFPIKKTIELTPAGSAIGFFHNVFSNSVMPNLRKLLVSGKFPVYRCQMYWDPSHKIAPLSHTKKVAPLYEKLALEFPNTQLLLSFSCEHNSQNLDEIKKHVEVIHNLAPSCIPVNTIWQGKVLPGIINEKHGGKDLKVSANWIASLDGISAYDTDISAWLEHNKNAEICFLWGLRYNLAQNKKPEDPFIPPMKRTAKPSLEYLKAMVRLSLPEGSPPVPIFSGNIRPIKNPCLWKSFGEDSQGSDSPRENRPLFICPVKQDSIEIVCFNGVKIGRLAYGGSYTGGLHRYYSGIPGGIGLYGYQIGNKAKSKSGSEWIWLKTKSGYYGSVNPSFRKGYFKL